VAYVISTIVLLAGVASFFVGFHQGVEFKGGRSYTIAFDQKVDADKFRDDLKKELDRLNTIKPVFESSPLFDVQSILIKIKDQVIFL
jgi:SecD/SecF fusion protein